VYIFVNKYSCISVLIILYNKIVHKCEFCQSHCVELFKRVHTKFILPFLDIPTSFYEFWNLHYFLVIKSFEKRLKIATQCRAESGPWPTAPLVQ
jgi:hypothetical protein